MSNTLDIIKWSEHMTNHLTQVIKSQREPLAHVIRPSIEPGEQGELALNKYYSENVDL